MLATALHSQHFLLRRDYGIMRMLAGLVAHCNSCSLILQDYHRRRSWR